jgi:hypothetical protein
MDISRLATLAGNTVVTAAVTDAWEITRHKVSRLFGRGQRDHATERRLDTTCNQLAATPPSGLAEVKVSLAAQWAVRLADLVEQYPDVEAELRAAVDDIRALLPAESVSAMDHALAAGRDINISVDRGGLAAGVVHGNIVQPGPTLPGPAKR